MLTMTVEAYSPLKGTWLHLVKDRLHVNVLHSEQIHLYASTEKLLSEHRQVKALRVVAR